MRGDYLRYQSEINLNNEKAELAKSSYKEATDLAARLDRDYALRLGLALNYSVLLHESLNDTKMACQIAEKALQEAIEQIDSLDEDEFRDAKSIIELLQENLNLWKEELIDAVEDLL
jgi:14-3-3 protein epsilon